jgi:hypothetical protein
MRYYHPHLPSIECPPRPQLLGYQVGDAEDETDRQRGAWNVSANYVKVAFRRVLPGANTATAATGRCRLASLVVASLRVFSLAWVAIVMFPICVPVLYLTLLLSARKAILTEHPTDLSRSLSFLHHDYAPSMFWWELVETSKKARRSVRR